MPSATAHRAQLAILAGLAAVSASALVYVHSSDVIWAVIPLLVAVAIIRHLMRRGADN
jgi:hypothetical protein